MDGAVIKLRFKLDGNSSRSPLDIWLLVVPNNELLDQSACRSVGRPAGSGNCRAAATFCRRPRVSSSRHMCGAEKWGRARAILVSVGPVSNGSRGDHRRLPEAAAAAPAVKSSTHARVRVVGDMTLTAASSRAPLTFARPSNRSSVRSSTATAPAARWTNSPIRLNQMSQFGLSAAAAAAAGL